MSPAAAARATSETTPGVTTLPVTAAAAAATAAAAGAAGNGGAESPSAALATVLRLAEAGRVLDAAAAAIAAGFLSRDGLTADTVRVVDAAALAGLDGGASTASAVAAVARAGAQAAEVRALQEALAGGGPCGEGDAADGEWALVHGPPEESAGPTATAGTGGGPQLPGLPSAASAPRIWYRRLAGGGHSLRLDGVVSVGLCPLAALLYEVDLYEQLFWFVRTAAALVPAASTPPVDGAAAATTATATAPAVDTPLVGGNVRSLLNRSIGLHLPVPWPMSDRVAGLVGYGVDDFDGEREGRPPALYIRCRSVDAAADGLAIPPFGRSDVLGVPPLRRPPPPSPSPPAAVGGETPADAAAVAAAAAVGGHARPRHRQAGVTGSTWAPSSSTHRPWPRRLHSRRRAGSVGSPRRSTVAATGASDARDATSPARNGAVVPPATTSAAAAEAGATPSLFSRASARLWAAAPAVLTPASATATTTTVDGAVELWVAPSGMALLPLSPNATRVVAVVSADPGLPTPPSESLVRWVAGAVAAASLRALEERGADLPRRAPAHAARVAMGGVYTVLEARLAEVWARQGELPVGKKQHGGEGGRHS